MTLQQPEEEKRTFPVFHCQYIIYVPVSCCTSALIRQQSFLRETLAGFK